LPHGYQISIRQRRVRRLSRFENGLYQGVATTFQQEFIGFFLDVYCVVQCLVTNLGLDKKNDDLDLLES
jgi:hypothetical protein